MEILLLQDIAGVGKKNDLLVVGDGFALNCLLPQRKALVATPTVRKRYAEQIKKRAVEKEGERQFQQDAVTAMSGKSIQFSRKTNKVGKLYAALTEAEISNAIKEQLALTVPADNVIINDHIKAVGAFQVQVKVGDVSIPLAVTVSQQKEAVKKAA
jgi:large subunit ribosomal protein L9